MGGGVKAKLLVRGLGDAPQDVDKELPLLVVVERTRDDETRSIPADEAALATQDQEREDGDTLLHSEEQLGIGDDLTSILLAMLGGRGDDAVDGVGNVFEGILDGAAALRDLELACDQLIAPVRLFIAWGNRHAIERCVGLLAVVVARRGIWPVSTVSHLQSGRKFVFVDRMNLLGGSHGE